VAFQGVDLIFPHSLFADDLVFHFCSFGFFGGANQSMAKIVLQTKYHQVGRKDKISWLHTCLLFFSFASMIGGLVFVFVLQLTGQFLPSSIVVQFDDDITPVLSTFSGTFTLRLTDGSIFDEGRVQYYNRIGEGTIGYCDELQAWTFGRARSDYCDDIMALSQNPTTRDISLILGQSWYAPIGSDPSRVLPMEIAFSVASCSDDDDCGGSKRGVCESSGCRCHLGFFGIWCNYGEDEVCDRIRLDKSESFARLEGKENNDFVVLRDPEGKVVTAYFHPVYISSGADLNDSSEAAELIFFAGLRWMLSSVFPPESGLHSYFNSSFHASHSLLGPIEATTEVVKFYSATDERPDPSGLSWFHPGSPDITEIMPVLGIDTFFTCSKCSIYNPCAFGNICDGDGQCICKNGEAGSFCRVIPVGDGQCNEFYNNRVFGYDGGDCCEGSCSSGGIHQCGIMEEDGLDGISVGFPFCIDPRQNCDVGMNECWSRTSIFVPLYSKGSSGAFMTVSGNGRTLVVSEPRLNTIRVFDHVDAGWVQRGQTLVGLAKSRFGTFVSISTLPGNVERRRVGHLPIVLAVGAMGNTTNYVEVYGFEEHAEAWSLIGQQLNFNETIDSLSIGGNGHLLSLAVGLRKSNTGYVYKQDRKLRWQLVFNTSGSIVGLSGNGQTVVCLSTSPMEGESQQSGIYSLSELAIPDSYDPGLLNLSSLPNLLPIEMRTLTFQSRPVALQVDYAGISCIIYGPVLSGVYGINGFAMIGLQRNEATFATDRVAMVGGNFSDATPELERPAVSVSPDTHYLAINLQKTQVEIFDINETSEFSESFQFLLDASNIPSFEVNGLKDSFAISDRGIVIAAVVNDEVIVAHRNPFCNGTKIRLAISLDDEPGLVSWSLDYARRVDEDLPGELNDNIASCFGCYGGDIRYSRVAVVEDVCIPKNNADCVQLTFSVSGRHMGEGAGFVAFADGYPFARYDGKLVTKVFAPGGCT
jgi:hypothetical protein